MTRGTSKGFAGVVVGLLAATCALALGACSSSSSAPAAVVTGRMDFARPDFYAAPFPSDDLRGADGKIALAAFPNPSAIPLVDDAKTLLGRDARGFSMTGSVFFALSGPIAPTRLPTLAGSVTADASVFLVDVDASSPDYAKRTPATVAFEADGGPFGAPNLLSILPLQGAPLRAGTLYAAVVLKRAADPALGAPDAMTSLAAGQRPAGLSDAAFASYTQALAGLAAAGVAASDVAVLGAFTTDSPFDTMGAVVADMLSRPRPTPGPFALTDTFDDFCVFTATIGMPDYQSGTPPYSQTGGDWQLDASGKPILQRTADAHLLVTVPRTAMPASGFPTTVFIRTGGGGDRPLVDRGTQAKTGGAAITPGTGPALEFARAGFAGVQVDGPLGGLRNTTNQDEQFLVFNVFNGAALRDNVRESAAEIVLLSHVLDALSIDVSACPGATGGPMKVDTSQLAVMGHSMGASILPLALAYEPRFKAAILSGAGASWIQNVMFKKDPLDVSGAFGLLLGYTRAGFALTDHDPVLTMFQWAAEPADSQIYARRIQTEPPAGYGPRSVFMVQGIVDHYILPPIANALSAPLGLDFVGTELDSATPEVADMMTASAMFPFSGRSALAYPVQGNFSGMTAVFRQAAADGIEDGHEVIFQTPEPKYQYKCFLASMLKGTPVVPDGAGKTDDAPCE